VTSRAFNLASDCLGDYVSGSAATKQQVALSIFSLMSLESGMNFNAVSHTGPSGPGQMSGGAIIAVNQELNNIRAHLSQSENISCRKNLAAVLAKPARPYATCDQISLDENNPMRSMAYAFAYQAASRRFLDRQAFNSPIFSSVFSAELPPAQKERLMMEASAWAHNTGPAGLLNPLRAQLMDYMRNQKKISTAQDVTDFLKSLRPYLASHAHPANRSRSRITETMNYYSQIQQRMALITKEPRACLAN
jgi:hypothetical protein